MLIGCIFLIGSLKFIMILGRYPVPRANGFVLQLRHNQPTPLTKAQNLKPLLAEETVSRVAQQTVKFREWTRERNKKVVDAVFFRNQ